MPDYCFILEVAEEPEPLRAPVVCPDDADARRRAAVVAARHAPLVRSLTVTRDGRVVFRHPPATAGRSVRPQAAGDNRA
jgi:hypothetical protein